MARILITGNKGFIASGLIGDGIDIKDGVDIVNYQRTKMYDVVIHTAALISVTESEKDPIAYMRTNIFGTLNMVRQHPEARFVYLSTAAIYGEGRSHTIESQIHPTSVYAYSKYLGECLIKTHIKSWAILRLTNVIGPGLRGEPNVYQVFEKEPVLPIYGDGTQTRDFVHVDEVRKVILHFAHIGKRQIVNVGSGVSRTILSVAAEFNKPIQHFPERQGEIKHFGVSDAFSFDTQP